MKQRKKKKLTGREVRRLMSNPKTDPMGSYTGINKDHYEMPTQDADDL